MSVEVQDSSGAILFKKSEEEKSIERMDREILSLKEELLEVKTILLQIQKSIVSDK